jgi:hypothetical protein
MSDQKEPLAPKDPAPLARRDAREPLALTRQNAALVGFCQRDFAKFVNRARRLRGNLQAMENEISEAVLVHERMLDELSRKLLTVSANVAEEDLEAALKTATVALKAHAEWRELIAPLAAALGEKLRAQKRAAHGMEASLRVNARAKVPASAAGLARGGDGGRDKCGPAGTAGPEADGSAAGGDRHVEGRLLGVPDRR